MRRKPWESLPLQRVRHMRNILFALALLLTLVAAYLAGALDFGLAMSRVFDTALLAACGGCACNGIIAGRRLFGACLPHYVLAVMLLLTVALRWCLR